MLRKMVVAYVTLVLVTFAAQSVLAANATREESEAKVQEASKMTIDAGIDAALLEIAKTDGQFVWKDSYVFAIAGDEAVTLAHPFKPKLVGKNLAHVKDINGVLLFSEFVNIGKSPSGKGWVDYMWPKPGEKKPSSKHTYCEKVPGVNVTVCAGYYE